MDPLFLLWLAAVVAFLFAYRAGRRRMKAGQDRRSLDG
jgi:hypothetical protein